MAISQVVWVIDTSSIIEVRRSTQKSQREQIFREMTRLVTEGRLVYPSQVVAELERNAQLKSPDRQFTWAKQNASTAQSNGSCSLGDVREILAEVPEVLDPNKDAGPDEADPYVLAIAQKLREDGTDARVVTEERKDTGSKMSMNTAAGILGIPSVPLAAFLKVEKIVPSTWISHLPI